MFRKQALLIITLLVVVSVMVGASASAAPSQQRWEEKIVIGWTPPDITGVFKTATDFFEAAAADANANGFNVEVITQSPASHTDFSDQVAIIEDYIQREVDVMLRDAKHRGKDGTEAVAHALAEAVKENHY